MSQSKAQKRRIERKDKLKAAGHSCADCKHNEQEFCTFDETPAVKGPCIDWAER